MKEGEKVAFCLPTAGRRAQLFSSHFHTTRGPPFRDSLYNRYSLSDLDEVVRLDLRVVPPPRGRRSGRALHRHLQDHLLVHLAVHVALRELLPDDLRRRLRRLDLRGVCSARC